MATIPTINAPTFTPYSGLDDIIDSIENIENTVSKELARFDKIFHNWFDESKLKHKFPPTNIYLDDKILNIEMAIAGYSKEDINVYIENEFLVVESKKESKDKEEKDNKIYYLKEISNRNFKRKFNIKSALIDNIEAEFTNGILKIKLIPKEQQKKQIEIK